MLARWTIAAIAAPFAAGYLTPPPGTAYPGAVSDCSGWVQGQQGVTCEAVEKTYHITESQLETWNPLINARGSCVIVAGFSYCIQVNFISTEPGSSSSSSSTEHSTTAPTSTSSTPAPSTTTPGNGIATPTPIQANMVPNCNSFHMVESGDTCAAIASSAGVSISDFYSWNPSVGDTCSSLWLGYYVCTGVIGATTTIPPATTMTGNGIPTPTPTQAGMVGTCNDFHLVQSGDTCVVIALSAGIPLSKFYDWNPTVGADCSSLWASYYVCTGVVGHTPTTTLHTTTTAGNGISTPTPTQAGIARNCDEFHLVQSGDTCAKIANSADIPLSKFYSWNPAVGSGCSSLWASYYVCTHVVGYSPSPTTTAENGISTPTPTQAGMVKDCDTFYKVRSGDTCASIAKVKGITVANIENWNPRVGSDCSSLWLGYYICIGRR